MSFSPKSQSSIKEYSLGVRERIGPLEIFNFFYLFFGSERERAGHIKLGVGSRLDLVGAGGEKRI